MTKQEQIKELQEAMKQISEEEKRLRLLRRRTSKYKKERKAFLTAAIKQCDTDYHNLRAEFKKLIWS